MRGDRGEVLLVGLVLSAPAAAAAAWLSPPSAALGDVALVGALPGMAVYLLVRFVVEVFPESDSMGQRQEKTLSDDQALVFLVLMVLFFSGFGLLCLPVPALILLMMGYGWWGLSATGATAGVLVLLVALSLLDLRRRFAPRGRTVRMAWDRRAAVIGHLRGVFRVGDV